MVVGGEDDGVRFVAVLCLFVLLKFIIHKRFGPLVKAKKVLSARQDVALTSPLNSHLDKSLATH